MADDSRQQYTAFLGGRRIAFGSLEQVAMQAKAELKNGSTASLQIFQDSTGRATDIDLRGAPENLLHRLAVLSRATAEAAPSQASAEPRRPGRPRLGVVAREITLLPRHWEWLATQPGGASVAIRKLVEQARRSNRDVDRQREARQAAYRFISAIAGNEPGFEEAARALFARDALRFAEYSRRWPQDVRDYALQLAAPSFAGGAQESSSRQA